MNHDESPERPPRDFADRSCRAALKHSANLEDLLSDMRPDLAADCDFSRAELMEREFQSDDWRSWESDLFFRIPRKKGVAGGDVYVFLLVEHQSRPDGRMPLRLLTYAVLAWDREHKEWQQLPSPRPPFKVTPIIPIVFHTGPTRWTANRTMADLFAGPEELQLFAPVWEVLFWDLAERSPQELLKSTRMWLKALAVVRAGGRKAGTFQPILDKVLAELDVLADQDELRWYDLRRFVVSWALKQRPIEERPQIIQTAINSRRTERREEISTMTMTIADGLIEEGEIRGRRNTISETVQLKFGKELPLQLKWKLERCTDHKRLQSFMNEVIKADSIEDLHF